MRHCPLVILFILPLLFPTAAKSQNNLMGSSSPYPCLPDYAFHKAIFPPMESLVFPGPPPVFVLASKKDDTKRAQSIMLSQCFIDGSLPTKEQPMRFVRGVFKIMYDVLASNSYTHYQIRPGEELIGVVPNTRIY